MPINISCPLKRINLPLLPCHEKRCDWYIHSKDYNCCFWVIAHVLNKYGYGLSLEEIAKLENITEEEVSDIIETALVKLRNEFNRIKQFDKS